MKKFFSVVSFAALAFAFGRAEISNNEVDVNCEESSEENFNDGNLPGGVDLPVVVGPPVSIDEIPIDPEIAIDPVYPIDPIILIDQNSNNSEENCEEDSIDDVAPEQVTPLPDPAEARTFAPIPDIRCCQKNEMWVPCRPKYEETCQTRYSDSQSQNKTHSVIHNKGGCICQPGYIREKVRGKCIKRKCCWEPWCDECQNQNPCGYRRWVDDVVFESALNSNPTASK